MISSGVPSYVAVTVPCFTPVRWTENPASCITRSVWAQCADVAMSKSFTSRPRSESRTQPPTTQASCPAFSSASTALRASSETMMFAFNAIHTFYTSITMALEAIWGKI